MAHEIEGLDLSFTSRTSWKAEVTCPGKPTVVVPVTWSNACRREGGSLLQTVWFKNPKELEAHRTRAEPFVVAVAEPANPGERPAVFKRFNTLFRVQSTGRKVDDECIETKVLERVNARNWP